METFYDRKSKYDIFNRIQKNNSVKEVFMLIIKQNMTNNLLYYFLFVLFRFFPLIILTGNYHEAFIKSEKEGYKSISDSKWIRKITIHKLVEILKMNNLVYIYISLILFGLFIIRIMVYLFILNNIRNKEINNKWPNTSKYQKIMDHIAFLFFPYIIEFLSFIYLIIFTPNKFIIKNKNNNKEFLIINTLLIIGYNSINYIYFICFNKIYTLTWYEAYESLNNRKFIINNPIKYKYPKIVLYIALFLQNFSLFQSIEIYIINKFLFKIIITCVLLLIFIILFFLTLYKYNYSTFINIFVDVLIFYCFYSIIIDFFLYLFNDIYMNGSTLIIYIFVKILISFLSYISLKEKINRNFFKNNINEIFFEEKNKKKNEDILVNCLLYLNELMIQIKEKNEIKSAYLLIGLFTEHINNCHKIFCNCKILQLFLQKELTQTKVKPGDKSGILDDSKGHIPDLLVILNYLYESIFIDYDYYNKYYLSILLAEHFCHLKNNPTMAFSLINTLILKKKEKLRMEQLIVLYELCQKYIYYILALEKTKFEKQINNLNNKTNLIIMPHKDEFFRKYFNSLEISYKVRKIIDNYIDNEIKILKYKNIFEETIEFKFDENNEEITKVDIKFFEEDSNLKKDFSDKEIKNLRKLNSNSLFCNSYDNLFYIISLLKVEQYDYNRIINSIQNIEIFKGLSIILIFKFYLFFDIFEGGKIPSNISNKLNMALSTRNGLYSNNITSTTYSKLIEKLKKQNYLNNSKYYTLFQYKKEFRIKYFNETYALILGYKQKDIINAKIDVLMPKEFCKSHQNMVKRLLIYEQLKYINPEKGFVFDSRGTIFYTIKVEGIMIYELSKNLMLISEHYFIPDNEYRFMLNNNFELLAHTKNFENEYSLNYSIFQNFNLKLLEIFKIKPNKLYTKFADDFKNIHYQKYFRQAKVEEYFTPQLFVTQGDKNIGIMNPNYFNSIKNSILSKIVGNNKDNSNINENNNNDKEEEIDKLINSEKSQKIINDFFFNTGQIIFNSNFYITLSKRKFLENLAKELSKIPDTDLMFEGDKINYKLIISSKNLIQKLLTNKELNNNYLEIQIKLTYLYDKPFYFLSVFDKKKLHFKINKTELLLNSNSSFSSLNSNPLNKFTKNKSKITNKIMTIKARFIKKQIFNQQSMNNKESNCSEINNNLLINNANINNKLNMINNNNYKLEKNENNSDHYELFDSDKILEKMEKYKNKINSVKFIRMIKYILSIICIIVLIIYIIIMNYQKNIIELSHKTFRCYYYNFFSKNIILHFQTVIIEKFYNVSNITVNTFTTEEDYKYTIELLTPLLKEAFHDFTNLYYDYNLEIGHNLNLMFTKRTYYKLGGFWEEIPYFSDFPTEMDSVIYNIYAVLDVDDSQNEIISDINNFMFKKGIENKFEKNKVYSNFIKLMYYFDVNYELTWSLIFENIDKIIMDNYRNYVDKKLKIYYFFEVIGLAFIIIFYIITIAYLYYANSIIIKNIIFLFLDFSDDKFKMLKNGYTKLMMLKLIEFKTCISDFSLEKLNIFGKNIDNIDRNKYNLSFIKAYTGFNSTFERSDSASSDNKSTVLNRNDKKSNISSLRKIDGNLSNKKSLKEAKSLIKDESSNINNSSLNYINRTNSTFLKDKLNTNNNLNNLIIRSSQTNTISNNNVGNSNIQPKNVGILKNITSNRVYRKSKNDDNINNNINYDNNNDSFSTETIQDIILTKSNKSYILLIKIYSIIVYALLALIIAYSIFKLFNTVNYHNHYETIFYVFKVFSNRYTSLNYYYNTLKATIIFPMKQQIDTLEKLNSVFEDSNDKFDKIINKELNNFDEIKKLFDIIKDSKNNSTNTMLSSLCYKVSICEKYLYSPYNIMDTGIDFLYKSIIIDISKIYLDYKNLKDINDINKIQDLIINNKFDSTSLFIEYAYNYIKFAIYNSFKKDEEQFKNKFKRNSGYLNIITVIFAFFSFLFVVVFIFITISIFADPIKKSTLRISCSFYFIKKYNFLIHRNSQ